MKLCLWASTTGSVPTRVFPIWEHMVGFLADVWIVQQLVFIWLSDIDI